MSRLATKQSLSVVGISARCSGSSRHRAVRADNAIPVRFPSDVLHQVKRRAEAGDRSVAS
ncbi:Arc family DNA-binding protein [Micromonospora coerulea]|uniref:Arc family DNA-binding protein n=1 Tax=Micromonospora coerulea TaxID=47856 RepID=UPI003557519E